MLKRSYLIFSIIALISISWYCLVQKDLTNLIVSENNDDIVKINEGLKNDNDIVQLSNNPPSSTISSLRTSSIPSLLMSSVRVVAVMHPDWLGVRETTESFNIPCYMSINFEDNEWAKNFLIALRNYEADTLLISGIPFGSTSLAKKIKEQTNITVILVYHGTTSMHHYLNGFEVNQFSTVLQAFHDGHVDRIGLIKYEFVETLKDILSSDKVYPISNFVSNSDKLIFGPLRSIVDAQIHIGIFGTDMERENALTQLMAACSLGSHITVHAFNSNKYAGYLKFCTGQIIWHDQLSRVVFKSLISQMNMLLYISLSDCQPMVAMDSLKAKVPIILSNTVSLFGEDAPILQEFMICSEPDKPDKVRDCILKLLNADQKEIQLAMANYLSIFNVKADEMLIHLLGGYPVKLNTTNQCSSLPQNEKIDWFKPDADVVIKGRTVVFCGYEIGGVTPGGFGTFIDAIIRTLLKEGVHVILFFEFIDIGLVQEWKNKMVTSLFLEAEILEVVHLSTLLPNFVLSASKPTIWWQMAEKWERGLFELHKHKPFDVVEMHEYVGLSAEIFRRRMDNLETLPLNVKVVVRVHGSVTHVQLAENYPYSQDLYILNLLERFVVLSADLVLFPSKTMQIIYEESFGVLPVSASVAPLPMDHLARAGYDEKLFDASTKSDIMFWGKIQALKGVFVILEAVTLLLNNYPKLNSKIHFYGLDLYDTTNKMKSLIPFHLKDSFIFHGFKSASELPSIVQNYRVAIIASKFETFCYAAHDLHQLRIPLIVPDIPVFQVFNKESTLFFEAGKSSSLKEVIYKALTDDDLVKSMQKAERVKYLSPVDGYKAVFSFNQHFQQTQEMCKIKLLLDNQIVV